MIKKTPVKKVTRKVVRLEDMSKADQKVAVAKDVIKWIKSGKYKASTGSYVTNMNIVGKSLYEISGEDIKENWGSIKTCQVCGVGACLMSITKFKNKLKFGNVQGGRLDDNKSLSLLKSVYTPKELAFIEVMFEGKYTGYTNVAHDQMDYDMTSQGQQKAIAWYTVAPNSSNDRLTEIMKHIIKHKTIKL